MGNEKQASNKLEDDMEPCQEGQNIHVFITTMVNEIDRKASLMEDLQQILDKFTGEDPIQYNRVTPVVDDLLGYNNKMKELQNKMEKQNTTLENLIDELNNYT